MKWVNVNNSFSGSHYELWNNDKKLVSLSISTSTKISRIECAAEKRLFFIEKKGFLQSRTVIKNEYGILVGELHGENWEADKGSIELGGKKYNYSLTNEEEPGMVIFEEAAQNPLVKCSLSPVNDEVAAVVKRSKSLHDTKYPSLLMALCWYLWKAKEAEAVIIN